MEIDLYIWLKLTYKGANCTEIQFLINWRTLIVVQWLRWAFFCRKNTIYLLRVICNEIDIIFLQLNQNLNLIVIEIMCLVHTSKLLQKQF